MKYCKDCVWHEPHEWSSVFARCMHPRTVKEGISPVDGTESKVHSFCSQERSFGACGPEAKLYEAYKAKG